MTKIDSLHALFIHELGDLYDVEHQITDALPTMIDSVRHPELKKAFQDHLAQTERHIERLETVFESLGEEPKRKMCDGIRGILKEGEKMLAEDVQPDVLDVAIIGVAQKVEHYEIAAYGTVREYARMMAHLKEAEILEQTLEEEGETDKLLTKIAKNTVNLDAPMGHEREMAGIVAG